MDTAIDAFKIKNGVYPSRLDDLAIRPQTWTPDKAWEPIMDHVPRDPWDTPYFLVPRTPDEKPVVRCAGPDGILFTEDDVSSKDLTR